MPGALRGQTIDGRTLDLASQKGHAVVLNVWGSWCAPCQKEAPALEKASQELKPKGVSFIGINTRENGNKEAAAAFQRAYGITYPACSTPTARPCSRSAAPSRRTPSRRPS